MKNRILVIAIVLFSAVFTLNAQVEGVSIAPENTPPHANAMLEIVSSDKGILIPRMSYNEMMNIVITNSPANPKGLLVFVNEETEKKGFWYYTGTEWKKMSELWQLNPDGEIYYSADNVGVGLENPQYPLDVNGSIGLNGSIRSGFPAHNVPSSLIFNSTHDENVTLYQPYGNITYYPAYSDQINLMSYSGRFYFNDNMYVDGTVTQTSDSTLKKNIAPIDNSLEKIKQIDGVTFYWKDQNKGNTQQMGLIAQDVEAVYPQAVVEFNGVKAINYNAIIAALIESIKEQQQTIEELENRIEVLENNQ